MTVLRKYFTVTLILIGVFLPYDSATAEDCFADPWSPDTVYSRGDEVTNQSHEWRAKRTTTGIEPGTHKPTWANLGTCGPDNPPPPPPSTDKTPIQFYGVWHGGNHYADWSLPRDMEDFDEANHWIIDRGDGTELPSVNLVVLSFLQPMDVLEMDPDDPTTGVPVGMTQDIVDYFTDVDIRVMMSIGGVTYTDFWDEALAAAIPMT